MQDVLVPFNDLKLRFAPHQEALVEAARRVIESGWVVLGAELTKFEVDFAEYLGATHAIGVATGTDAIEIGLRAIGVESQSKVGIVANAAMYSYIALQAIGAEPIFMDVDVETRCATLSSVKTAIDAGAQFVVITHLYGLLSEDIQAITDLCLDRGVGLFEDCAQAHGASRAGKMAGSFGAAASFSFYPTKNLGAIGDGGAIVTHDDGVADRVKTLRQYGWSSKYTVEVRNGTNSRLDEIQAAFLSVFLLDLDANTRNRRDTANRYSREITHANVVTPYEMGDEYVAHLYVVASQDRDGLRDHLKENGVLTDVHYPIADHKQPILRDRYGDVELPVTEQLCDTVLSLPCYPNMSDEQVTKVIDAVNAWGR